MSIFEKNEMLELDPRGPIIDQWSLTFILHLKSKII